MDDMAGKISELLSDPEGMEKIKAMASALFGGDDEPKSSQTDNTGTVENVGLSLPDSFDPMKLIGIFSALNNQSADNRAALLMALKPHLSYERQERVEKAVKLLKIASLLPILRQQGLLDDLF